MYSGEKPEKLKKNLTFENGGKNLEQQSAEVALRCVALRCVHDEDPQKGKKRKFKLKNDNYQLKFS